jgi:hypothetical protein
MFIGSAKAAKRYEALAVFGSLLAVGVFGGSFFHGVAKELTKGKS